MSLLRGLFPHRHFDTPTPETRDALSRLIDDLQVIAATKPATITILGSLAHAMAAPIRRQLAHASKQAQQQQRK